jgi:RNA polymerase sigma factor (sigma-70 family)
MMAGYSAYTDQELIALLKQGDETAFDEIYLRYWKKYYNEAYKRLRNAELCEELVQDVFADLWLKRGHAAIENLGAYISTTVRYQVFMQYKKGSKMPVFEEPMEYMAETYLQADSMFELNELKARIDDWLQMQPEKRREIFKMRFMDELSTKEISALLGISQKTVQNQIITATNSLKTSLGNGIAIISVIAAMKV